MTDVARRTTDILVLGAGGAGLLGALHAKSAQPDLRVTVAVKGLPRNVLVEIEAVALVG